MSAPADLDGPVGEVPDCVFPLGCDRCGGTFLSRRLTAQLCPACRAGGAAEVACEISGM